MIHINWKINLRFALRLWCWGSKKRAEARLYRRIGESRDLGNVGHRLQFVQGMTGFDVSFSYCKRCGKGWRNEIGFAKGGFIR